MADQAATQVRQLSGPPLAGLPRLLPPGPMPLTLAGHVARYGPLPEVGPPAAFIADVERSGLRGRGGAGFPTARKLAAVAGRGRRRVVVANGSEGEPASSKDRTLLTLSPHLVLDGVLAAAAAVGADEAVVCVDRPADTAFRAVTAAVAERQAAGGAPMAIRVEAMPSRYVAGEETALVSWLNGGDAKPAFVPPRPFERGVHGRPTLVDNVETLAHLGLIARYGGDWFAGLGTPDTPGTMLLTLSGAVARPGVMEAACGTPLHQVLAAAGGVTGPLSAVLVGGYFGTWVPVTAALALPVDLRVGAGVIIALPAAVCGLVETARLARWLAAQSAGQCGPCTHGLPAIAGALDALAAGRGGEQAMADLHRWLAMVRGRGACHLPDGVSRLVASALDTFGYEVDVHRRGGCTGAAPPGLLPLPGISGWR